MRLSNCKVELSLELYETCILSSLGTVVIFTITDTKLYVPVVTLKIDGNVKLSKLLSKGFGMNEYKVISNKKYKKYIRERLDASIQVVHTLFVFPYMRSANLSTDNSYDKYFLPRLKIDNYNIEIFMISQLMTQLSNMMKSEKYQQDKVMITQLVVYEISLILSKNAY